MTARRNHPYRTGRADLVRAFLERNRDQAFTAREVASAVEPGGKADLVHATLANLARAGEILKLGSGYGNVHFCAQRESAKPKREARAKRTAPPTPTVPRKLATTADAAALRDRLHPKPARETISGLARLTPARRGRSRQANFAAAPGTVSHHDCPARRASAALAADIAAFQAGGGKIEVLGTTQVFRVAEADNDED
ncbi:hypothetical protein [Luteimonas notoginsengisoli]|uniref:Uncharacterized protein n=1 Tax=Luteimonas notoginsengisoli TaxID=1578200 RepID=A0ABV7UPZ1_9GAMM